MTCVRMQCFDRVVYVNGCVVFQEYIMQKVSIDHVKIYIKVYEGRMKFSIYDI